MKVYELRWKQQEDCHICISHKPNRSGYPQIRRDGKGQAVSRYIYEKTKGVIPKGLCVCHSCDNRKCINPSHLFLGTITQNTKDRDQKGRTAKGERHGMAKLTKKQVIEILTSKEKGVVLAKKFKVHHSTVHHIRRGNWWRHIDGVIDDSG
jgi:hypothetical protein